jgi:hypothetical protein
MTPNIIKKFVEYDMGFAKPASRYAINEFPAEFPTLSPRWHLIKIHYEVELNHYFTDFMLYNRLLESIDGLDAARLGT